MDNRTINQIRNNETKLINEMKKIEEQNKKYKEVFEKIKKVVDECWYMDSKNIGEQVFSKKCELKEILKEAE